MSAVRGRGGREVAWIWYCQGGGGISWRHLWTAPSSLSHLGRPPGAFHAPNYWAFRTHNGAKRRAHPPLDSWRKLCLINSVTRFQYALKKEYRGPFFSRRFESSISIWSSCSILEYPWNKKRTAYLVLHFQGGNRTWDHTTFKHFSVTSRARFLFSELMFNFRELFNDWKTLKLRAQCLFVLYSF